MRVVVYARVSKDAQGQGRSVAEQEAECRAWAEREGWTVVRVIAETGSASRYARSTAARTRWGEVADAITSREADALLTWEASRAHRDLADYAALRDLCVTHGVKWGYSGALHDLADRDARFRTGLDALLAEDEAARTSERIRRGVRARAAAGEPHGKILYGYRRVYDPASGALTGQVPDEATAPIVRRIFRAYLDGDSMYRIAADLTADGITPPRPPRAPRADGPRSWIPSTVRRILTNSAYAARRMHLGQDVGRAAWEPLIDPNTFERTQALLAANAGRSTRRDARWLLSGIARCGLCDGPMLVHLNRGTKSYSCRWCHKVTRSVAPVDEVVVERLLALLAVTDARPAAPDDHELVDARADLDALRQRLEGFVAGAADGSISPATLAKIEARLGPQIDAASRRVMALAAPATLDGLDVSTPTRSWWDALPLSDRRRILSAFLRVRIMPAGRGRRTFNPELIETTPLW